MSVDAFNEIFEISSDNDLSEVGGGHGQKGIEFQKYWAIISMIDLYAEGEDFLILFETLQDIAILNSSDAPTEVCVYQVKKKDRGEWTWNRLTSLTEPEDVTKSAKKQKDDSKKVPKPPKSVFEIKNSPIGKLYATICAIKSLKRSGKFISNAGVGLSLADGSEAATFTSCQLSDLESKYLDLLNKGLQQFHPSDETPNLSDITIEKVSIPVDDPQTYTLGKITKYLINQSPRHASQAQSFLSALLTTISPLGAKTDKCISFDELRKQRGYNKLQFASALSNLEALPDFLDVLKIWRDKLGSEGMDYMALTNITIEATKFYTHQLTGNFGSAEADIINQCEDFLKVTPPPSGSLMPFFENAYINLSTKFPKISKGKLQAIFALKAIEHAASRI